MDVEDKPLSAMEGETHSASTERRRQPPFGGRASLEAAPEGGGGVLDGELVKADEPQLRSARDVLLEIERVYASVKRGNLKDGSGWVRICMLNVALRAVEVAVIEERVNVLEAEQREFRAIADGGEG